MNAIASQLAAIVHADSIQTWDDMDAPLQTAIHQAIASAKMPQCIVYPATQTELQQIMECAYTQRWRVLPVGSGSKVSWGGLVDTIDVVISTAQLNRVVDYAAGDLTVTVEAGVRRADLQTQLEDERQFLALDPTYAATATLGGVVATADTGAWRQRYGGVRDMLIGLSFVRYDGQLAKAGGRVVKNVAGYDLMKVMTGSYGTLGILSQVTFRLYPQPATSGTVAVMGSVEAIAATAQTLLTSALTPTAVELVTPTAMAALGFSAQLGLLVRFQSVEVSVEQQSRQLVAVAERLGAAGSMLREGREAALWKQLQARIDDWGGEPSILCKIGIEPHRGAVVLDKVQALLPGLHIGLIHAASGLGLLRFSSNGIDPQSILEIRQLCQLNGGFLTVLEAPPGLKQSLDVWGYAGNALSVMRSLKQQFDPHQLISPRRFVGGI